MRLLPENRLAAGAVEDRQRGGLIGGGEGGEFLAQPTKAFALVGEGVLSPFHPVDGCGDSILPCIQCSGVGEEEGRKLAEDNEVLFMEVSAKSGVNIQEFFKEIASMLPEANDNTTRDRGDAGRSQHNETELQSRN